MMLYTTLSAFVLSVLSATAFASPVARTSIPLAKRGGPSGTLVTPNDGTGWSKVGAYFGTGHVVYQGVSQDYNIETSEGEYTHVETYSIEVYLESEDGSVTYPLTSGVAPPNSRLIIDEYFLLPTEITPSSGSGNYRLFVVETQIVTIPGQPGAYPEPETFQSASPLISISASPVG